MVVGGFSVTHIIINYDFSNLVFALIDKIFSLFFNSNLCFCENNKTEEQIKLTEEIIDFLKSGTLSFWELFTLTRKLQERECDLICQFVKTAKANDAIRIAKFVMFCRIVFNFCIIFLILFFLYKIQIRYIQTNSYIENFYYFLFVILILLILLLTLFCLDR